MYVANKIVPNYWSTVDQIKYLLDKHQVMGKNFHENIWIISSDCCDILFRINCAAVHCENWAAKFLENCLRLCTESWYEATAAVELLRLEKHLILLLENATIFPWTHFWGKNVLLLSGGGCVIAVTFREFHDLDQEISAEIVSFTPRALPYNIFLNQKNEFILKRQQNEMLRIDG